MVNKQIEDLLNKNKSFIIFRKPNVETFDLWCNTSQNSENYFEGFTFKSEDSFKFNTLLLSDVLINDLNDNLQFNLTKEDLNSTTKEEYIDTLSNAINFLNKETSPLKKIVLSRTKDVELSNINPIKTFKKLHTTYANAYLYLLFNEKFGVWIGASPELLLAGNGKEIKTVSLAGTLPKNEEWTSKEIREQNVVTEYIVKNFSGLDDIKIDGPHTIDAGFFNHLKSYISAKVLFDDQIVEIAKKLHPTPAVCGLPKEEAKEYIFEYEGYDRKLYSGYLGFKKGEQILYFVNLRCAQLFKNKAKLYVGGGIMPDSNPTKEWEETELKSKTIGNFLVTD